MLEILQYVTSGFWVFVGSSIFMCLIVWSINVVLLGIRGK